MNKSFRQGQILKIIRSRGIFTQEELARELAQVGIQTTQVTLSRDMRELSLVKTGEGYRRFTADPSPPSLSAVADEYLLDIRIAQNLVVLQTSPGHASTVAVTVDRQSMPEVVGTIAGDDTVLVITQDNTAAERFRAKVLSLIS
jgi:transcriptional regulator of arginine metabolism